MIIWFYFKHLKILVIIYTLFIITSSNKLVKVVIYPVCKPSSYFIITTKHNTVKSQQLDSQER